MTIQREVARSFAVLGALILAAASMVATSAQTAELNRAGLVIVHGDGRVIKRCVEFSEETISGLDLLQRAGLDLNVDPTDPIGTAVCRIDSEGCTFPGETCFCQCQGMTCVYWSYWQSTAGGDWKYSNLGLSARLLKNGDSDGWIWGQGNSPGLSSALPVGFDEICTPPTATPTATDTHPPPTNTAAPAPKTDTPEPPEDTPTRPAPASTVAPVAITPVTPSATPISPAFAAIPSATSPRAAAPSPLPTRMGTAVVTTPTTIPAAPQVPTQTPSDRGDEAAVSPEPGLVPALRFTPAPTLALVAQVAPSATARLTRGGPTPTALLAVEETVAPPPLARTTKSPGSGFLLAAGIVLAAASAGGVTLFLVRRS